MSEKIQPTHLERDAYVYVRQSSTYQVRHNVEGQRRQYALADRARELGFRRVVTIDEDLGRSGAGTVERPGFGRLLAAVCDGLVGAVLALEASRLARNNRDWHHLIDLCSLTDTLVIDMEGVYNPRVLNDRLLLGLKGSMSEFELGLLRQRAREAFMQAVARGDIVVAVPVGYVKVDGRCEMDPDRQVQEAIRMVFSKFRELATVRQTLLWFREERVALPSRPTNSRDGLRWSLPTYPRILAILRSPTYAGAFTWGRTRRTTRIVKGRARHVSRSVTDPSKWQVLLKGHHEGYVSWEDYVRNQRQIDSNRADWAHSGKGAPRAGPALLAGLLRCGRCGRRLKVAYGGRGGRVPRYLCNEAGHMTGQKNCLSTGAVGLDAAVVEQLLAAVGEDGIVASIDAIQRARSQESEKRRALALAIEKARYETKRRHRQYEVVEPENRLVAAELERRWEEALRQQSEVEERLAEVEAEERVLSPEECDRIRSLSEDLPRLWSHPACPVELQKRILRTVIEEIVIDLEKEPPRIVARLHWKGGVHTTLHVRRRPMGRTRYATAENVVELVRDLARILADRSVATVLNRLGYRTGHDNTWTRAGVCSLRNKHGIPVFDPETPATVVTLNGASERLGLSTRQVRALVRHDVLAAKRLGDRVPWIIKASDLEKPEVQEAVRAIRSGVRRPWTETRQNVIPFPTTT